MPRLLQLTLRPYMNPEPGSDGSTPTEAPAAVLSDSGLSPEEFAALPDADRAALLADTLDDTTPIESEAEATILREQAERERQARIAAAPQPTPAPTPAPTAAPAATPAPTAAPKAEGQDDDVDEAGNKLAGAPQAPAATPAPTAAPTPEPTAAPKPAWTAVDATVDNVLALPEIADPAPFKPRLTEAQKTERTTAQAALDELEEKFDDGSITAEELKAQRAPLREQIRKVDMAEAADQARADDRKDALESRFDTWLQAGFATAKAAGLDYLDPANKQKVDELDAALGRYAQAAPLIHPGKSGAFLDRWALNEAHKEVAAKYGVKFEAKAAAAAASPAAAPAPVAARAPAAAPGTRAAPDLSKLPPTLAKAPPAADPTPQVGEFAHLEGLTPADHEKAVARMTPEQQDRYLGV